MPDRGIGARLQQVRGTFISAQKDWNDAKTCLASLRATYEEKKTLAGSIYDGRQSRSTPDKATMLEVEIEELKECIDVIRKEIIGHRTQMDAAISLFEELEGYEVVDEMPGMSG
ncbi:hypothetical protein FVEN_g2971 [Fusarium venenatum]|uniref:Uncharacterized protein n=1 Tax=Fusarium venenatum TaxID=56646 RepID=A0A2L2T2Y0_9HYPO|nr:uncharacterized protein FVRRES_06359 [Fusarium venenatum]KAG8359476.1 hypothetical protein FVEN_g2971 [Fusarium venenatum]KAH6993359.1 hypothetical protein EDB82DRAFT_555591 [Fusarium venenatum]CEI61923.1 unnamed protein product [Fusarium venenatum]